MTITAHKMTDSDRWVAEVSGMPEVVGYGFTKSAAISAARRLAIKVKAFDAEIADLKAQIANLQGR